MQGYKSFNKKNILKGTTLGLITLLGFFIWSLESCKHFFAGEYSKEVIIEKKVDSLLALMTLEEKIGQMSQVRHFDDISDDDIANKFIGSITHAQGPVPGKDATEWQSKFTKLQKKALSTRLGIPLLFAVDAIHGQNTYEGATIFPHNIGMGATGNETLVQEAAQITAKEIKATGFNWTFSPCMAIPFNEKWGRVYEAYSECPELTSKLVKASVRGHQGELNANYSVLATAKHFIGDGSTDYGKEGGETNIKKDELQKLLSPYRVAVKEEIGAVQVSLNSLSGQKMHANKALITDTLKIKMGFKGIVITDWKGYSKFGYNKIINAGVDMVMAVDGDLEVFQSGLKVGVLNGSVSKKRIDDAVSRILRQKYRLGLFENPFPDSTFIKDIGSPSHRAKARQSVRESLVLLKNENATLPLKKKYQKIVVVGEHADNTGLQSGGWTVSWQGVNRNYKGATSILEGIKKVADAEVVYDQFGNDNHFDADTAIIVVGESPYAESFGDINDKNSYCQLKLSQKHQDYINKYAGKVENTIVILISGRPLIVTNQIEQSDAFIAAWLPGSEGDGIAEVLFGDYNFKGKLPHTWPKSVDDFNRYGPNYWDKSIDPLFEIGYGLSY